MKNQLLLLSLLATTTMGVVAQTSDPTLMTVADKKVPLSEFEYAYSKNSTQLAKQESPKKYLELYKLYKQKVADAEANGLDTLPSFTTEYNSYYNQLTDSFLIDTQEQERLVQEAYEHMSMDLNVSHILFLYPQGANDKQKKATLARCLNARKRAVEGGEDFAKLARELSDDTSARENSGQLGYLTGFVANYTIEKAAYDTPLGGVSQPVETGYGYHLLKVLDRRTNRGTIQVAHIMKMANNESSVETAKTKKVEIDYIYEQLLSGADFATLAREKSDDTGTSSNGGELPWFGTGQMVSEFESAAFALKNVGDISAPIKSSYGWHIIKLLGTKPLNSFEVLKPTIEERLKTDVRSTLPRQSQIEKLKQQYSFQLMQPTTVELKQIAQLAQAEKTTLASMIANNPSTLFTMNGQTVTLTDLANYLQKHAKTRPNIDAETAIDLFTQYYVTSYERKRIVESDPELRNLAQEYHDGLLMFEISNQKVWQKAASDTIGLKELYNDNKRHFRWRTPRFKGYLVQCETPEMESEIRQVVAENPKDSILTRLSEKYGDKLKYKIEYGIYKKGKYPLADRLAFESTDTTVTTLPTTFTIGKVLKKEPEVWSDVSAEVIKEYQTELEKAWLKEIKRKYAVEIDKDVLKTVKKQ